MKRHLTNGLKWLLVVRRDVRLKVKAEESYLSGEDEEEEEGEKDEEARNGRR